jgi:lycopene cyclase-like protein
MVDALVIGSGPAALAIAAALCDAGLQVAGMAPHSPDAPWPNNYGIWRDELEPLGLAHLLGHSWTDTTVYAGAVELPLGRAYGLFDNTRLQSSLLERCERGGMEWHVGHAAGVEHGGASSEVTTREGGRHTARLVVDASGHKPALLRRPAAPPLAFQAAYGIVGEFSRPPVRAGQLVLMDYRAEHLPPEERGGPPTFLYALDLGAGEFFVEETSLAAAPPVSLKTLEERLLRRLAWMGVETRAVRHVERCLFPMNAPLADLAQPLLGFGGAASMVHPASGYQVGAALRRAPGVAGAVAQALGAAGATPHAAARAGWRALWPRDRLRRRALYLFGLASLLPMDQERLSAFFRAFFHLPRRVWSGYMSDRLTTAELLGAMLRLFGTAPAPVRLSLTSSAGKQRELLRRAMVGSP